MIIKKSVRLDLLILNFIFLGLLQIYNYAYSFYLHLAKCGPACFLVLHFNPVCKREHNVYIGCNVLSVSVFRLYFCETEIPASHLYVDVKGKNRKILALLDTRYTIEMLILNEDSVMHPCLLFSVGLVLRCNSSVSSARLQQVTAPARTELSNRQ